MTLDDPKNHMFAPATGAATLPFGGYNNVINQDPAFVMPKLPVPKAFGMPSDTAIPDFHLKQSTAAQNKAFGMYHLACMVYVYPTDLTDIQSNAQPGPAGLAGAYATPK